MKWQGQRESSNVEDRRSSSVGRRAGGLSIGGIVIALIVGWIFGVNPLAILGFIDSSQQITMPADNTPAQPISENDEQARFVASVLGSTEDVWNQVFKQMGQTYTPPKLVLFRGTYPTACGMGQSAMGPFYCPADQKVYIDLSFYDTLKNQLGAPGEFAQAYVIAHEVGHHVQNLLGIAEKVELQNRYVDQRERNAISVRVELQADCFAGFWARAVDQQTAMLEDGDIEAALNAASKIGDDALQRQAQGRVVPDSFTHGTSSQRVYWFKRGLQAESFTACDTFSVDTL